MKARAHSWAEPPGTSPPHHPPPSPVIPIHYTGKALIEYGVFLPAVELRGHHPQPVGASASPSPMNPIPILILILNAPPSVSWSQQVAGSSHTTSQIHTDSRTYLCDQRIHSDKSMTSESFRSRHSSWVSWGSWRAHGRSTPCSCSMPTRSGEFRGRGSGSTGSSGSGSRG